MRSHGKDQDASTFLLGGVMTELLKLLQIEDGEILSATPELVNTPNEQVNYEFHDK